MKEVERNDILPILLAIGLGVAIGANWGKIQKGLPSVLAAFEKQYGNLSYATLGALATQKEKIEDMMAAGKEKKGVDKKRKVGKRKNSK